MYVYVFYGMYVFLFFYDCVCVFLFFCGVGGTNTWHFGGGLRNFLWAG